MTVEIIQAIGQYIVLPIAFACAFIFTVWRITREL